MTQFKFSSNHLIASVRSDIREPVTVETTQPPIQEVSSASIGFLVLFSSLILLYCSMRRWKTSEPSSPQPNETEKLWPGHFALELPCTRCHYFKANRYLPCAVNPTVALKPDAIDCTDFVPREEVEIKEVRN